MSNQEFDLSDNEVCCNEEEIDQLTQLAEDLKQQVVEDQQMIKQIKDEKDKLDQQFKVNQYQLEQSQLAINKQEAELQQYQKEQELKLQKLISEKQINEDKIKQLEKQLQKLSNNVGDDQNKYTKSKKCFLFGIFCLGIIIGLSSYFVIFVTKPDIIAFVLQKIHLEPKPLKQDQSNVVNNNNIRKKQEV